MKKQLAKLFNLLIIDFGVIIGQMTSSQNQIGIIVEKAKPVDDFRPDSPHPGRPQDFFPGRGGLIIDHLNLTLVAEKPPLARVFAEVALMAAEVRADYI
jgi:hypothetical protein